NRPARSGADGLQHARMPEGSDVAALLQFEADLIDAARRIDREHELQVGGGLRRRPSGDSKHQEQRPRDGGPGPGAPKMGGKADVYWRSVAIAWPGGARFPDIHGNLTVFIRNFQMSERRRRSGPGGS